MTPIDFYVAYKMLIGALAREENCQKNVLLKVSEALDINVEV